MMTISDVLGPCTGCAACYAVCNTNAISFSLDENGFYTAKVDSDKCVGCEMCYKVCSKNNGELKKNTLQNKIVYAACTKDKGTLNRSTSGAIAYEISKYGLKNGYLVFGVEYDIKENVCRTVCVENEHDLQKIQGSKYIQSDTSAAFKQMILSAQKDQNKKNLVFGTPCQIFGLCKALELKGIRDRFTCVELFCHGVPSKLLFDRFLSEKQTELSNGKVNDFKFRDKKYGWHMYTISVKGDDKMLYETSDQSDFYKMYFDHAAMNPACIRCIYRKGESLADIRLGDFWGKGYIDNDTGISAALIVSKQGQLLWDNLKRDLKIFGEFKSDICLKNQSVHDYKIDFGDLNENLKNLKVGMPLKRVIKNYRKSLSIKLKVKNAIKEVFALIPNEWKITLKKMINRIRSKG